MIEPRYPTPQHQAAAAQIVDFFAHQAGVDGVLLVNSIARGKATADSCLDIIVLVEERLRDPGNGATVLERGENRGTDDLYAAWQAAPETKALLIDLGVAGRFAEAHLDIIDGRVFPGALDRDQAIDAFELAIGNYYVYGRPLWLRNDRYHALAAAWLPYYSEALRAQRLSITRTFCLYALDHIAPYNARGLYFQAFDRLYHAFQGFLQGLFMARRTYPLAYNKWIHEQVAEILDLPDLYQKLPGILEIRALESRDTVDNSERLRELVATYLVE